MSTKKLWGGPPYSNDMFENDTTLIPPSPQLKSLTENSMFQGLKKEGETAELKGYPFAPPEMKKAYAAWLAANP